MITPKSTVSIRDSIGTKMLKIVFGFYLLIAIAVTLTHMVAEYYNTKDSISADLEVFHTTFEPALATHLWQFDEEQLRATIAGMIKVPVIVGIKIKIDDETTPESIGLVHDQEGNPVSVDVDGNQHPFPKDVFFSELFSHTFPIFYLNEKDKKMINVGTGTLYSSTEIVFDKVQYGFIFIIVNSMIKTLALWIIFLLVIRKLLNRPLTQLTAAAEQFPSYHLQVY